MSANFLSEDWEAVVKELKDMIESELHGLETTTNEKEADKHRGALKVLRRLQGFPKRYKVKE